MSVLSTLTDQVLQEVQNADAVKEAAANAPPAFKSELGQRMMKLASQLKNTDITKISYEDLQKFQETLHG